MSRRTGTRAVIRLPRRVGGPVKLNWRDRYAYTRRLLAVVPTGTRLARFLHDRPGDACVQKTEVSKPRPRALRAPHRVP